MYIQHNMMAAEANRFLKTNGQLKKNSTEKLSSGYRINRAADDAAGLTISEKMRGQIRGLNRASENIQDGISLIQTAEGALQETQAILQRMRELSVQAANDTYVTADREAIQLEIDALTEEVDRIAQHTEFNNGIYPLLGGAEVQGVGDLRSEMLKYLTEITVTVTCPVEITYDGVTYPPGTPFKVTGVYCKDYTRPETTYGVFHIGGYTIHGPTTKEDVIRIFSDMTSDDAKYDYYSITTANYGIDEEGRLYQQDRGRYYYQRVSYGVKLWTDKDDPDIIRIKSSDTSFSGLSSLWIQAGANATQGINISLVDGTAEGLGLTEVSVLSTTEAGDSLQTVDDALNQVSRYRSDFGAQQNRLEHAMTVDDNTAENIQAAESRIRDLDMADEMVTNAKSTIMEQSMHAMLANANRQTEGVLALLQG